MMQVLITRPEDDAKTLKSRIEALGCTVSVSPLIEIEFERIEPEALAGASGLVATSRNALKSLAQSSALADARSLPIFVVGPATADLARDLGFIAIHTGPGTAAGLVRLIAAEARPMTGNLVHLSGDHQAYDLVTALKDQGIAIRSIPAYRSVAAKSLNAGVLDLLQKQGLDAVVLMSPRTARIWAQLLQSLPVMPDLSKLTHVCLSPSVAQGLRPLNTAKSEIAGQPDADEMVALVYRLAGRMKTG